MSSSAVAVALGLCCSALWAAANIAVHRASRAVGNLRALLWAQLIGSAALVPVAWALEGAPRTPDWGDLAITAAASGLGYYGMIAAFSSGALTAVVPVVTAWAVPAAVVGVVWSGDLLNPVQLAGGALVLAGALGNSVLATRSEGPQAATPVGAVAWAVGGALGFGVMAAGTARLQPALGALGVIPAVWLAQWVLLAPLVALQREVRVPPPRSVLPVVAAMALLEGGGFVCFTLAARFAPVAVVSPPASLSSIVTVLYGWAVLRERLSPARWACVGLVALGMGVVALA